MRLMESLQAVDPGEVGPGEPKPPKVSGSFNVKNSVYLLGQVYLMAQPPVNQ